MHRDVQECRRMHKCAWGCTVMHEHAQGWTRMREDAQVCMGVHKNAQCNAAPGCMRPALGCMRMDSSAQGCLGMEQGHTSVHRDSQACTRCKSVLHMHKGSGAERLHKCERGTWAHKDAQVLQEEHERDAQGMHTQSRAQEEHQGHTRMHKRDVGNAQGCTRMPGGCKEDGWGCPREAEEGVGGERGHREGDEDVRMKQMGPRMGQGAAQGPPEV